ncbi:MAG TPA: hypothetical protein VH643_37490 [Gemmataceae bacterium]
MIPFSPNTLRHASAWISPTLPSAKRPPRRWRTLPLRYAQVRLRITDGKEQREWPAWVSFTPAKLQLPLLGFAGFLQFFTATFQGDYEQVELAVNNLYPGT